MKDGNSYDKPRVAVGILVFKRGQVLFSKRQGSHGEFTYGTIGGHLEHLESFQEGIRREINEEAGIQITNLRWLCVLNFKDYAPRHFIDIGFVADWSGREPKILEPDRCLEWLWREPGNPPEPLFKPVSYYLRALKEGKRLFDIDGFIEEYPHELT